MTQVEGCRKTISSWVGVAVNVGNRWQMSARMSAVGGWEAKRVWIGNEGV